jgi:hypothetical protein
VPDLQVSKSNDPSKNVSSDSEEEVLAVQSHTQPPKERIAKQRFAEILGEPGFELDNQANDNAYKHFEKTLTNTETKNRNISKNSQR